MAYKLVDGVDLGLGPKSKLLASCNLWPALGARPATKPREGEERPRLVSKQPASRFASSVGHLHLCGCLRVRLLCLAAPQSTNPPLQQTSTQRPEARGQSRAVEEASARLRECTSATASSRKRQREALAPSPVAARKIRRGLGHRSPTSPYLSLPSLPPNSHRAGGASGIPLPSQNPSGFLPASQANPIDCRRALVEVPSPIEHLSLADFVTGLVLLSVASVFSSPRNRGGYLSSSVLDLGLLVDCCSV